MKWEDRGRSRNLEDRRGARGPARMGVPLGIGGLLIVFLISAITGVDLSGILGGSPTSQVSQPVTQEELAAEEEQVRFVSFVLDDVQDLWTQLVQGQYPESTLVLYRDAVESGCGVAPSAAGPFYCPLDMNVYIDLSFYDDLHRQLGAPGDFAQAYVIAHEVGHHVQNVLGVMDQVESMKRQGYDANELSVRTELMADCLAGVWAYHGNRQRSFIEPGDVEEALNAAAAIGDDRLQERSQGQVVPDSFTHGSSEQRVRWFRQGLQSGDIDRCDTFAATTL